MTSLAAFDRIWKIELIVRSLVLSFALGDAKIRTGTVLGRSGI